ncbi:kinase inhibitor [Ammoniphilus oxalaticus]|uniref:Kinase inhibitor n=1 Tax=Ammoniphilus oxalaticus TaxID=66863 RepID=A0A419SEX8_9BACL|nr:5-oxoprolinase subunit PxpB [Ammoniphilus oxalaticus]RKD21774.1 kinase inhibitor [Ammoniphilus oxalaticus]
MKQVEFSALGDSAVLIRFGLEIDERIQQRVTLFMNALEQEPFSGWIECVPGYSSVAVFYDPMIVFDYHQSEQKQGEKTGSPHLIVVSLLKDRLKMLELCAVSKARTVEIPVCYDFEFGPDLKEVAAFHRLDIDELIQIHTECEYLVFLVGFSPGFPYLGGLDPRIATPRKKSPRLVIPAGSVGIGGEQTGIYPIASPGGWQLIGRTPLRLFCPDQRQPSLLQAGDRVRFRRIDREQYERLKVNEK